MTTYTMTEEQRIQWLDTLNNIKRAWMNDMGSSCNIREVVRAIHALQSLQPNTQEPVAWMTDDGRVCTESTKDTAMANSSKPSFHIPLYTQPAHGVKP